jgi:hypothetical protein
MREPTAVRVNSYQAAYACLWRLESENPAVHEARRHLLQCIGGQGSDAQRDAIAWSIRELGSPEPHPDDTGSFDTATRAREVEASIDALEGMGYGSPVLDGLRVAITGTLNHPGFDK